MTEKDILVFMKEAHVIRLTEDKLAVNLTHGIRRSLESIVEEHPTVRRAVGWLVRFAYPEDIHLNAIHDVKVTATGTLEITKRSTSGLKTVHIPDLTTDEAHSLADAIRSLLKPTRRTLPHHSLARRFADDVARVEWVVIVLGLLTVWELGSSLTGPTSFPSPTKIASAWWELNSLGENLLLKLLVSYRNLALGLLIASVVAIPFAILNGLKGRIDFTFTPIMMLVASLPDLAILPLIVYFTGHGEFAAVIMIMIASFFPIFFSVRDGVKNIPKDNFEAVKMLGAGRIATIREVVVLGALPSIITGIRLAFSYCWQIILAIEMIANVPGIGLFIKDMIMSNSPRLDYAFAAIFTVGIAVLATDRIVFAGGERKIKRWRI